MYEIHLSLAPHTGKTGETARCDFFESWGASH
jgi:hypothetical protein